MSSITGAGFTSGAAGAGLNEAVIKEIDKIAKHDPGMAQIVSAIVGAAAAKAVGGNAGAGAAAAASGTKWNFFGIAQRYDGSFISIADDMMVQEVENILIKEDGSKISRDEATQVLNDLAVLMETLEPDKTSSHFRLVEKFSSIVRLGEHLDVRHARRCLTLGFDTMQRWGSIR